MIFKVSLVITLVCLATSLAVQVGWLTTDEVINFVLKVGVVSSLVAAVALLAGK